MHRVKWDCCDSVTETESWIPSACPICKTEELEKKLFVIDELSTNPERIKTMEGLKKTISSINLISKNQQEKW